MVLGFAELPTDKRPPEAIWLDEPGLVAHFRAHKLIDDPDDDSSYDDDDEPGVMVSNRLADDLLKEIG